MAKEGSSNERPMAIDTKNTDLLDRPATDQEPAEPSLATRTPEGARFAILDGCRGLASLGVVASHLGIDSTGFGLGHGCVIVFFVISGYCIAASVDACQRDRLPLGRYYLRRLRRIYPPYFFSIVMYIATRLLKEGLGLGSQMPSSVITWIQNFTMTQWITLVFHPETVPHRNPALLVAGYWSLNYEEQFYVVMGLFMLASTWLKLDVMHGVIALMLPAVIWNLATPSLSYGFFIELWVTFALGAMVYYRGCGRVSRRGQIFIDIGILLVAMASLWLGKTTPHENRSAFSEWLIAAMFALALILMRPFDNIYERSPVGVVLGAFGAISYSLYLTHQMVFTASGFVASKLLPSYSPHGFTVIIRMACMIGVATVFWYFCEKPFLNRRCRSAR